MPFSPEEQQQLNALGSNLRALREARALSLRDLGHLIDKDPQSIHRVESGGVNPSYLYMLELCKGLEIELCELLKF